MEYNPQNETWGWLNVSAASPITEGKSFTAIEEVLIYYVESYRFTIWGGESADESLHSFYGVYDIFKCIRSPLQLTPNSGNTTSVFLGESFTFSFSVTNNDERFCSDRNIKLSTDSTDKTLQKYLSPSLSRSDFRLGHYGNTVRSLFYLISLIVLQDFQVTVNAGVSIPPLEATDLTRTFVFNVTGVDSKVFNAAPLFPCID